MFVAVTAALGTARPEESATWPTIDPVIFCASTTAQVHARRKRNRATELRLTIPNLRNEADVGTLPQATSHGERTNCNISRPVLAPSAASPLSSKKLCRRYPAYT